MVPPVVCPKITSAKASQAHAASNRIHERPLPNLEDPRDLIRAWDSRPRPAGCAFYPRNSEPRVRYAGTYDEKWKAERAPALPEDFRFDFYNAADPELQVQGYLQGNEAGALENVTPGGGRIEFMLPCLRPRFSVTRAQARTPVELQSALDTVVLLPDDGTFYVIWRAAIVPCDPEASDVHEVRIEYDELQVQEGRG
ncbi:MAG: DUF2169 domain-containing protein [Polyangiaceae bacterium]